MPFYLLIIVLSTFFFYCCEKNYKRNSALFCIFYFLYVMILTLLGGFRDDTVGEDLMVYGISFFDNARHTKNLYDLFDNINGEYAYHILNWLCGKISKDIHFLFFVMEFSKIVLVSSTALYFRKRINATLFIFAYLCFFYFTGYSILRQSLAIAISIYGLRYWFAQKQLKFLTICFIALLFHSSALVMFLIFPIAWIANKGAKTAILVNVACIAATFMGMMAIMDLLKVLDMGILSDKAVLYTEVREGVPTAKTNILLAITFLFVAIMYNWRSRMYDKKEFNIFIVLILWNLFFLLMSQYLEVMFRCSWYQIPFLMMMYLECSKRCRTKILLDGIFAILFFVHFMIAADYGLSGTIPYASKTLGIYRYESYSTY